MYQLLFPIEHLDNEYSLYALKNLYEYLSTIYGEDQSENHEPLSPPILVSDNVVQ